MLFTLLRPQLSSSSLPHLLQIQPTKNPNKTLKIPNLKFKLLFPFSSIMSSSSSWACSKCTFLNPSSQKSNCQICQTPFSLSSSSSPSKWACKACTFLNSYSLSNCEICDTRSNLQQLDSIDPDDDDLSGVSSVGSVFFPLRRCNSGRVQEPDDLGIKENGQSQMGVAQFADQVVHLGGLRNSGSNKRKFHDLGSDNADAVSCLTTKKEEKTVATKSSELAKIADSAVGNVSFKRKLCDLGGFIEKPIILDGFRGVKSSRKIVSVEDSENGFDLAKVGKAKAGTSDSKEIAEDTEIEEVSGVIKILSYNVWFKEELEVHKRMQAIGDLIELHSPDVICFQEVTPNIYDIFRTSAWWKKYQCSVTYERASSEMYYCIQLAKLPVKSFRCKPFSNSQMCRDLGVAEIVVNQNKSLVVATSHLESPTPGPPTWDQMNSKERVEQAKEAINQLKRHPNVIFCGDMNWDDNLDGKFPYLEGWFDAWERLRPAEMGWTYDTKSNNMLSGNRKLQKRLDRFICHLTDFKIISIDMIGTEAIPGVTFSKQKKLKNRIQELILPVFPSDHFGLLLTITCS
ncbi:uncharacterized protein LOC110731319 [Chenopodium quinoa]|nr:uncharacterized protein LOC110731319 [Chenopodium quinoa]